MRTFKELLERSPMSAPPISSESWTLYQARSEDCVLKNVKRDPLDWGISCIYHFDRDVAPTLIPRFLEVTSLVDLSIRKLGLENAVRLVPYYEVGSDFLVQAKAPYDGGYSTSRFGEFIVDGDCKPPPGFVLSRAQLCEVLIEQRGKLDAGSVARTQLLSTVLHNSFIRPWSELFWDDDREPCWTLFRPWIGKELMQSTALAPH